MKTCRARLHQYEGQQCPKCQKAKADVWRAANLERYHAAQAAWRKKNPERRRAAEAKRRSANPERERWRVLLSKLRGLGFTEQEIETHRSAVNSGKCEACGGPEETLSRDKIHVKQLSFDHNHETGRYRGTLCQACNMSLGFLKDRPDRLRSLIAYLERTAA
jgi:hypothetical protein